MVLYRTISVKVLYRTFLGPNRNRTDTSSDLSDTAESKRIEGLADELSGSTLDACHPCQDAFSLGYLPDGQRYSFRRCRHIQGKSLSGRVPKEISFVSMTDCLLTGML